MSEQPVTWARVAGGVAFLILNPLSLLIIFYGVTDVIRAWRGGSET